MGGRSLPPEVFVAMSPQELASPAEKVRSMRVCATAWSHRLPTTLRSRSVMFQMRRQAEQAEAVRSKMLPSKVLLLDRTACQKRPVFHLWSRCAQDGIQLYATTKDGV